MKKSDNHTLWVYVAAVCLAALIVLVGLAPTQAHEPEGDCYPAEHFVGDLLAANSAAGIEVLIVEDISGTPANEFALVTGWPPSNGLITRAILFAAVMENGLERNGLVVLFNADGCAIGNREFFIDQVGPLMKTLREKYSA